MMSRPKDKLNNINLSKPNQLDTKGQKQQKYDKLLTLKEKEMIIKQKVRPMLKKMFPLHMGGNENKRSLHKVCLFRI